MRDAFCRAMIALSRKDSDLCFLTGDLGFQALEPLREVMRDRFINAGVSEQNMVSVGAGIASEGAQTWLYSIAPFLYARPFEQIRNDICLHNLNVKLVGNGGGYAYGSMGATHHALEDYGTLLGLQGMRVFVPVYDEDVMAVAERVASLPGPAYLRLGRGEVPSEFTPPAYAPYRQLLDGEGPVLIAVGPLAGYYHSAFWKLPPEQRPEIWSLSELPLDAPLPSELLDSIAKKQRLGVAEEHVAQGGAGSALAVWLATRGAIPKSFRHFSAQGYPSKTYGSQSFHRQESGLAPQSVLQGW